MWIYPLMVAWLWLLALVPGTGGIKVIDAEQHDERTTTQTDGKAACCTPYQSHGKSVITRSRPMAVATDSARQKILVGESNGRLILDVLKREYNSRM